MPSFPKPSQDSDQKALIVIQTLNQLNLGRNFMFTVLTFSSGQWLVTLSGSTRGVLETTLNNRLRAVQGGANLVSQNLSILRANMMNPVNGRQYGFYYGGNRDCSEPKALEASAGINAHITGMTTAWYGTQPNPYPSGRQPTGVPAGSLSPALPCPVCSQNETRMMMYFDQSRQGMYRSMRSAFEAPF